MFLNRDPFLAPQNNFKCQCKAALPLYTAAAAVMDRMGCRVVQVWRRNKGKPLSRQWQQGRKKLRRLHWLAIPASTQIFMAAPQNVGVGQRVRLHGLSTQQLNGAEGVVRDPLTDGRVGVAITSAAAEVLER